MNLRIAALLGLLLLAPALSAEPLTLDLNSDEIQISDLSMGGSALVLGAGGRLHQGVSQRFFDQTVLHDEDQDGTVVWDHFGADFPVATWLAIDLSSGDLDITVPETMGDDPLAPFPPSRDFTLSGDLALEGSDLQLIVVRPGTGAWTLRAGDAGSFDQDQTRDGFVQLDLADLEAVSGEGILEVLQPGDQLIAFDPNRFTVAVAAVTVSGIDGGPGAGSDGFLGGPTQGGE